MRLRTIVYCYVGCVVIVLFLSASVLCCLSEFKCFLESIFPCSSLLDDLISEGSVSEYKEEAGPITNDVLTQSLQAGREMARAAERRGEELVRNGVNLRPCSQFMTLFFTSSLRPDEKKAARTSHEMLSAAKVMQMKICGAGDVTPNSFLSFLEHQVIKVTDLTYCKPVSVSCKKKTNFRTIDGSCNNLNNPAWGRRGAAFTRIAKPRYADGISSMPIAKSGYQLPNPRVLSTRLFLDRPVNSRVFTHLNAQFGQFITHDMMLQVMEGTDEGGIQCCSGNGVDVVPPEWKNDKCIPIRVLESDPFYSYFRIKCLNFVRSVTVPSDECFLGYAEQMNTVTSYLDASHVYGSDKKTASKLRTKSGGKLRTENRFKSPRGFLPSSDDKAACVLRNLSEPCYLGGDVRINQTPTLAALHTLFVREHNRIAEVLGSLNPFWSDERLYQEARRIVIAEMQHITYQEWLPLNFGDNYYRYYRISPNSLFTRDYADDVNAGVINSFAAGAFRFLHTVIPDGITTCSANYQELYKHRLSDHYFNPSLLETNRDSFDDVVRGLVSSAAGESDPFVTSEITNLLFKSRDSWGLDLISMDIQRGRDHGLASYNEYREICGLQRAKTFQDLAREIPQDRINSLQYLYESVDDIDLFVGGALETDVEGSILGQTFQCIVAEQFYRTRIGDRFFYDNGDMPHSFTSDQLKEIKKATMARLICDNTDGVHYVQRKAFEIESVYNPKYRCNDYNVIPYVDLTPWKSDLFEL